MLNVENVIILQTSVQNKSEISPSNTKYAHFFFVEENNAMAQSILEHW